MNKGYVSFFVVAIFLASQAFVFLHEGSHKAHEHEHSEQDCGICFSTNYQKLFKPNFINPINLYLLVFNTSSLDQFFIFSFQLRPFESRAPPIFS
jgi:hypothetical protein